MGGTVPGCIADRRRRVKQGSEGLKFNPVVPFHNSFYLEKLRACAERHDCDIRAYVLMTNHVHLLVTPHDEFGIAR